MTSTFANPGLLQPLDPLVQPDGRILLGGTLASVEDSPIPALLRLNPDGSIDPTFEVEVNSESGSAYIWRT